MLGRSRVMSSGPSLVSRASISNSSMWIEVYLSSRTTDSLIEDGVLEVVALPGHEGHQHVAAQGQLTARGGRAVGEHAAALDPLAGVHRDPLGEAGPLVAAHELVDAVPDVGTAVSGRTRMPTPASWPLSTLTTERSSSGGSGQVTPTTVPAACEITISPELRAAWTSIPVPTTGASETSRGTACFCMLEPMRARLASSCSRKGMREVATETVCLGETSM